LKTSPVACVGRTKLTVADPPTAAAPVVVFFVVQTVTLPPDTATEPVAPVVGAVAVGVTAVTPSFKKVPVDVTL
jgi:hypothetical protein